MSTTLNLKNKGRVIHFWRAYPLAVVSVPLAAAIYVAFRFAASGIHSSGSNTIMWVGLLAALVLLCGIAGVGPLFLYEEYRRSGIDAVDQMDGVEFENRLKSLFEHMGYTVDTTKTSGDYGADLVLVQNGERTVVQAKRYSANVGLEAVQEAVAAMAIYGATSAVVATNSWYTKAAKTLAAANNVRLIERDELVDLLASQADATPERAGGRLLLSQIGAGVRPVFFAALTVVTFVLRMAWSLVSFIFGFLFRR